MFVSLYSESGVARGEDALTVLDCMNTRNLFIDDLMEVIFVFKLIG